MKESTMTDNWNDAATSSLKTIWEFRTNCEEEGLTNIWVEMLRGHLDLFIESNFEENDNPAAMPVSTWWTIVATDAIFIARDRGIEFTVDSVQETLVRKQRDYGHENIRRFGLQGLLVRIHDKVARLENLVANGGTPNNESIEDTLLDIVGYSAIGIMWEKGEFMLDLKPI
jgi:hypothetical protein